MGSAVSNTVQVTITPVVIAPVLNGVLNARGDRITLTWTEATGSATAFLLYKNANNAGYALYQTFGGSVFSYIDTITDDPVAMLDSAEYYLLTQTATGLSGPSNQISNEVPNARI